MVATPSSGESARYSDGSFSESEDIYMTINTDRGPEFYGVEPPRAGLTKNFSQNERQISVDPISLQESTTLKQGSFRLVSPPTVTPDRGPGYSPPVPSPPSTLSYVSSSYSSSASSSPQSTSLVKKIWKSQNSHKKSNSRGNRSGSQSTVDDTHHAILDTNQKRSLSLGEGRRSSTHADEFNLGIGKSNTNNPKAGRVQSKPPLGPSGEDRLSHMKKSKSKDDSYPDDGFKCGKLCLFLPKGKGKPVRSVSGVSSTNISVPSDAAAISRTVSMERFECGSWSSSLHEDNEGDSANLFFDLPMEMLRCSVSDMQSPVTAAFVFDNEDDNINNTDVKPENLMHP